MSHIKVNHQQLLVLPRDRAKHLPIRSHNSTLASILLSGRVRPEDETVVLRSARADDELRDASVWVRGRHAEHERRHVVRAGRREPDGTGWLGKLDIPAYEGVEPDVAKVAGGSLYYRFDLALFVLRMMAGSGMERDRRRKRASERKVLVFKGRANVGMGFVVYELDRAVRGEDGNGDVRLAIGVSGRIGRYNSDGVLIRNGLQPLKRL